MDYQLLTPSEEENVGCALNFGWRVNIDDETEYCGNTIALFGYGITFGYYRPRY